MLSANGKEGKMHRMIIEIITMKTQIEETEDKRKTTKGKKLLHFSYGNKLLIRVMQQG